MKRYLSFLLIATAAAVVIILLLLHAPAPLLYSEKDDAVTRFHTNTRVLDEVPGERATELVPLMGDLLDQHGGLTLNVRLADYDIAARDLREYLEMTGHLDSLVINLDMTESEVEEWRRLNRDDLSLLSELVNSTTALAELRSLEIRYRGEGNQEDLYAVTIEGGALKRKLEQLYEEYRANKEPMVQLSQKYELNTTLYEQSVTDFAAIVGQFVREQEERERDFSGSGTTLSLQVSPDRGVYHDTLTFSGVLKGPATAGKVIGIVIDGQPSLSATVEREGQFQREFLIDRIRAGDHVAYAQSGRNTFSLPVEFRVDKLTSTLTLTPAQQGNRITCEGTLSAGRIPVTGAPVEIQADGETAGTAFTDEQGHYVTTIALPPGTYAVKSWFAADGYPLTPAGSPVFTFTIHADPVNAFTGRPESGIMPLAITVLILGASVAAAIWYLRRKAGPGSSGEQPGSQGVLPGEDVSPQPAPAVLPGPTPREQAIAAYRSGIGEEPGRAIYQLFQYLVMLCQGRLGLRSARTMTPRELCRETLDRPFSSLFRAFISGYEPVRYGGIRPAPDAEDTILARFTAVSDAIEEEQR